VVRSCNSFMCTPSIRAHLSRVAQRIVGMTFRTA
jgi:hypothetical protein